MASSFKLLDLFFPVTTPFIVINPTLAIVFESLVVLLFLPGRGRIKGPFGLGRLLKMALSWKVVYAAFVLGLSLFFPVKSFLNLGLSHSLHFFLLESVASVWLIFLFQRLLPRQRDYPRALGRLSKSYFSVFVFLILFSIKLFL